MINEKEESTMNLNKTIKISLLVAIAVILMFFEFPILPIAPWLKIDLSDVSALIGALAFGPVTGIVIEGLKNLLMLIVRGTSTGGVGEFANFLIGVSLVTPVAYVYRKNRCRKNAFLGMALGYIGVQIIGILANVYLLIPAYGMQMNKSEALKYVTAALVPFNSIKAIVVFLVTYILYKKLSTVIFKDK